MDVSDFDFDLPESAIALRPAEPRDSARLLCVGQDLERGLSDHHVHDLPDLLDPGDLLVINDTKVIPAALKATRPARPQGGGGDVALTVNLHKRTGPDGWRAFIRPAKRLRQGDTVIFANDFAATVMDIHRGGDVALQFDRRDAALDQAVALHGGMPLPPYIARQRPADDRDETDYQTVYADEPGSVAAPTAGLHFTPELFDRLNARGVTIARLTLHVGAGTFLPVKSDRTEDHIMHSEWYEVTDAVDQAIRAAKQGGGRVIAVGTTALRALEASGGQAQSGETDIFITPGYRFKVVDGLMTNFHLPKSTLFMLVSALAGVDMMHAAYRHAIQTGYRFYSYGDSSLLWRR
ncbi:tRNA preQ1(34) S-adenosylmethionine ribosyltransferase-isomerase QueA [Algimonas porphyrae]|uniref:tRNA preQ1(34) S-adenosylmethionine ribosyltransferase-isomerase QueA n=1 Tax=Algimonas porphyrae TaxID=1128113 RepID=UPI0024E086C2|nr:tRNA preQ1(34) S-adenosylmethionine ribosyltransferase-isomerase QueA [Algimonas porphyrae]